jgi:hypothetical protein
MKPHIGLLIICTAEDSKCARDSTGSSRTKCEHGTSERYLRMVQRLWLEAYMGDMIPFEAAVHATRAASPPIRAAVYTV